MTVTAPTGLDVPPAAAIAGYDNSFLSTVQDSTLFRAWVQVAVLLPVYILVPAAL